MRNIIIITPVFNDWESFEKLINQIDKVIVNFKEISFSLIAVNDGSNIEIPKIHLPMNLKKIEILNMKVNQGHQICIANGIKYALNNHKFDSLILMDADGEDRPEEISDLIKRMKNSENISVVAKRVKRSEGTIFKIFYFIHKVLTLIFTGKLMNFGNFSLISKADAEIIIRDPTIVLNYSGTLKNKIKKLNNIKSMRGERYFGPSKMPLIKLIMLSFSIIAVFKMNVFIRSALFLVLLSYLYPYFGAITTFFQILIILFNILIYAVSTKSNEEKLNNLDKYLKDVKTITH